MKLLLPAISACCILYLTGCSVTTTTSTDAQNSNVEAIFHDSVTEFDIKVFYEPTAVPYTGLLNITNDTWDITKQSYQALFQNHSARTIVTPTTLSDMTAIVAQNKTTWTLDELIALGRANAATFSVGTKINISVFFVKGTYNGDNAILGVQATGYPYAFIFKDVVSAAGGTSNEQKYVEQAVVVHEVGHAVGLVNNGLPMVTNHEDSGHPKHNSNSQCVMYWQTESNSTILSALSNFIIAGTLNLFATDSVADANAYHP